MTKLANKRVLVTGAGSGMGRRIAVSAGRIGADVVLWDIDRDGLDQTLADMQSAFRLPHAYVLSVADRKAVRETAKEVEREVGPIDVVVSSAGVVSGETLVDLSEEKIERTFAVNTLALYWVAKAFLPGMIARNSGHLVTIASASGLIGVAKLSDYSASKWAAIAFDESLRAELAQSAPGVRTTVVCPYYVNTGMFTGVKSRFPWLLPILEEEYVVDRILHAVERNRRRLYLPWIVGTLPLMRVLPVPVFDRLANFLGVNVSMSKFVGRKQGSADGASQPASSKEPSTTSSLGA